MGGPEGLSGPGYALCALTWRLGPRRSSCIPKSNMARTTVMKIPTSRRPTDPMTTLARMMRVPTTIPMYRPNRRFGFSKPALSGSSRRSSENIGLALWTVH